MFGAIVIVSGPTVVGPLLQMSRPGRRVTSILAWESTTIDPIGAIIGVLVFTGLSAGVTPRLGHAVGAFGADVGLGALGGAIGAAVLWFLLGRVKLTGVLATEVTLAAVVATAAFCNALRADTGLLAAIIMGVALANLPGVERPQDRPFFQTVVQLIIAVLFAGSLFILREKILYYVLPLFFTGYLLYGFARPYISRAWRHEIEEDDDEPGNAD